jgi:hypothetical protein
MPQRVVVVEQPPRRHVRSAGVLSVEVRKRHAAMIAAPVAPTRPVLALSRPGMSRRPPVPRLCEVGFPIQREPEAAWPHFVGWRVNYEQAAYAIAEAIDAVPALWSGPRRRPAEPIPPLRPGPGLPS